KKHGTASSLHFFSFGSQTSACGFRLRWPSSAWSDGVFGNRAGVGVTDLQRTSPLSCRQLLSSPRGTFSKPPHGNGTTLSSWSGATFLFFPFFGATSSAAGPFRNGRRYALHFSDRGLFICWVDSLPDTRALDSSR